MASATVAALSRSALLDRWNKKKVAQQGGSAPDENEIWAQLYRRILDRELVPILGSAVRLNRVFDLSWAAGAEPNGAALPHVDAHPVLEAISTAWAGEEQWKYPLNDGHILARVAQFKQATSDQGQAAAKRQYLAFLKRFLLVIADDDETVRDLLPDLDRQLESLSFSDIVSQLDYPRYPSGQVDPLRRLVSLPLPIYVTTSFHDSIERALRAADKKPLTQFCLWNLDATRIRPEHRPVPHYEPTVTEPVVYHLFGYEEYPNSLVLSEDDYLDFLLSFVQDRTENATPLIPHYLREALASSALVLLGYRLEDWDFRVLFRWLVKFLHRGLIDARSIKSVAIHLDPEYQKTWVADAVGARKYLERYFDSANFQLVLGKIDDFIESLWNEWDRRRQGLP